VRVHAVLVVEVYVVHAQPLQRRVARLTHVLRPAVHPLEGAVLAAHVAELGRQHDLLAPAFYRPADELLVGEGAVHVGGVQERHPELDGSADGGQRLPFVARPVELAHPHAPEAQCRDFEPLRAELALLQKFLLVRRSV